MTLRNIIRPDRGITPAPCSKRAEPSTHLFHGMDYVKADFSNIAERFARIRAEQRPQPANVSAIKQRRKP